MELPFEIIQLITNECDVKTKFNILITCNNTYNNIMINTFYDTLYTNLWLYKGSSVYEHPSICENISNEILNKFKCITELNIFNNHNIVDDDIRHLKHLQVLYMNHNITNDGIKDMKLTTLHINGNITNYGLRYMNLKVISGGFYSMLQESIKYMNLYSLGSSIFIDNNVIKDINLNMLNLYACDRINDNGIKYLNLEIFEPWMYITNNGIKHLNLKKIWFKRLDQINRHGTEHMNIDKSSVEMSI